MTVDTPPAAVSQVHRHALWGCSASPPAATLMRLASTACAATPFSSVEPSAVGRRICVWTRQGAPAAAPPACATAPAAPRDRSAPMASVWPQTHSVGPSSVSLASSACPTRCAAPLPRCVAVGLVPCAAHPASSATLAAGSAALQGVCSPLAVAAALALLCVATTAAAQASSVRMVSAARQGSSAAVPAALRVRCARTVSAPPLAMGPCAAASAAQQACLVWQGSAAHPGRCVVPSAVPLA
jgi:hypothetical protein